MKTTEKIYDAYQLYLLSDKNVTKTLQYTKLSRVTLTNYIKIIELLDFSLIEYLDKKGNEKLSIKDALYICNNVLNPENQFHIFKSFILSPKKERIRSISEEQTCMICADTKKHFEFTPCCNNSICESCLIKTFESKIQDLVFKSVDCPFCNVPFSLIYCRWLMKERFKNNYRNYEKGSSDLWRWTNVYFQNFDFWKFYYMNLYQKYLKIIHILEIKNDYMIADSEPDFKKLLGDEKYYGPCSQCTPKFTKRSPLIHRNDWRYLQVCDIPRQCGNGEGGILVLEPEMFRCVVCKSRDENMDDGEFKKCPHCGIKTVKPDGCNFIYCGDHRWCWICNERIENNDNGHNKHYWTGPGTSPYTNQCRESIDSNSERFLIRGKCDCSSCKENNGAPICRNIDCMKRTFIKYRTEGPDGSEDVFNGYCIDCK